MMKQMRELDRLPSCPPKSPDLNLIEIVWSWTVKNICDRDDAFLPFAVDHNPFFEW